MSDPHKSFPTPKDPFPESREKRSQPSFSEPQARGPLPPPWVSGRSPHETRNNVNFPEFPTWDQPGETPLPLPSSATVTEEPNEPLPKPPKRKMFTDVLSDTEAVDRDEENSPVQPSFQSVIPPIGELPEPRRRPSLLGFLAKCILVALFVTVGWLGYAFFLSKKGKTDLLALKASVSQRIEAAKGAILPPVQTKPAPAPVVASAVEEPKISVPVEEPKPKVEKTLSAEVVIPNEPVELESDITDPAQSADTVAKQKDSTPNPETPSGKIADTSADIPVPVKAEETKAESGPPLAGELIPPAPATAKAIETTEPEPFDIFSLADEFPPGTKAEDAFPAVAIQETKEEEKSPVKKETVSEKKTAPKPKKKEKASVVAADVIPAEENHEEQTPSAPDSTKPQVPATAESKDEKSLLSSVLAFVLPSATKAKSAETPENSLPASGAQSGSTQKKTRSNKDLAKNAVVSDAKQQDPDQIKNPEGPFILEQDEKALRKRFEKDPTDSDIILSLGSNLEKQERYSEAWMTVARAGVTSDPRFVSLLLSLGNKAGKEFETLMILTPEVRQTIVQDTDRLELGRIYEGAGKIGNAIEIYRGLPDSKTDLDRAQQKLARQ